MIDTMDGTITVYKENDLKTVKHVMLKVEFDPYKEEMETYRIAETQDGAVWMDVDLFYPKKRTMEYLERENTRLEDRVTQLESGIDDLKDTIEAHECAGFGEDI